MKVKLPKYDEGELVEMLRKQDQKAFHYLNDSYSDVLYGVVLKVVRTEETAQDLLQDIFVKIWRNITLYDAGKGRLFTWTLNIARNTSIDYLRARRPEIQDVESILYMVESNQKVYNGLDNKELREIVSRLKPEQQTLIEMVYWGGYTQKEVAQRLELPLGTVKTRIRSAIGNLRSILVTEY